MDRPPRASPKQTWRKWAKAIRSELDVALLSQEVAKHLTAWQAFQEAEYILTYLAFGSEIDLSGLDNTDKTFYVTRTWETDRHLTVHRLDGGLELHPFGYSHPSATSPVVDPQTVDLALVPGLCFAKKGTRLGYGRGYYDRLLPKLRPDIPLVGVVAEALIVPELPKDHLDIDVTHLVTETGIKLL